MKTKTLLCIALLGISLSASADFRMVARAYEVAASDFRAPATASGAVFFKACAACDTQRVRVTPNTKYLVNGKSVPLRKFREAIALKNRKEMGAIIVKHHLESDTVVSIKATI